VLELVGFLFPTGINWGFHFLGFLPKYFIIIYLIITIAAVIYISRKPTMGFFKQLQNLWVSKPYHIVVSMIIIFILCSLIIRVGIPLLGDGFYIVKNLSEALRGSAPLDPRNEPLSTFYFWGIVNLFKISSYEGLLNAFLIADIFLLSIFIPIIFYLVRLIFNEPPEQLLSFFFLTSVPYIQLFFGYIETYAVVLLTLSLFLLSSFLYLRNKSSIILPTISFLILFLSHYLSILLLPSLIYLGIREYRTNGIKNITKAIGILSILILILLVVINFNFERFYAWVPHSHFLPLSFSSNFIERYTEPYTLFSFYHGVDLFNYIILMAFGAMCLLLITYFQAGGLLFRSVESKFLILSLIPLLIFIFILKFDLGMSKDWDIFSSYFILLAIYAIYVFFQTNIENKEHIALLIIIMTSLSTLTFLIVNSNKTASINRYQTILDKRLLSNYGYYSSTLSLALYYHQINDTKSAMEIWERYTKNFPLDAQGYRNVIINAKNLGVEGIRKTIDTYEQLLKTIPQDTLAIAEYSAYCLDMGNLMFSQGALQEAKKFYAKVILLTPYYERGYNNLGSVYAQEGKNDTAIHYFNKAIELDSNYSDPYYNLGTIYEEQGNKKKAFELFKRSAMLNNKEAEEKLKIYSSKK